MTMKAKARAKWDWYYIQVRGGVSAILFGPYKTRKLRDIKLKARRQIDGEEKHTHLKLRCFRGGGLRF